MAGNSKENVSSETYENYFEASEEICDDCSETSDASFHSFTEALENVALEDSLSKKDSSPNTVCTEIPGRGSPVANNLHDDKYCTTTTDLKEEDGTAVSNDPSDLLTLKETSEGQSPNAEDCISDASAVVNDVIDNDNNGDDEFDTSCIDSVKLKDEEREVALKDRDMDLPDDEIKRLTSEAVEQKREGNVLFTSSQYSAAISLYNKGLTTCPLAAVQDRAMLYHNRAVAYTKLDEKKLSVHSLSKALDLDPEYLKAVVRRAAIQEDLDNLDDALQDYKRVLELQPGHREAAVAVKRLPPMIEERNEKLKTEMMGKLKDLGNMVLRPFGLSTNNFQMQQNEGTGGYNIQFVQNSDK